jgi:short-subunit dehydrogenase
MEGIIKTKNILITGSSMGIGKGLSECFAKEGAHLALADHPREEERLLEWAQELEKTYGIKTWTYFADLTAPDGPERLHKEVCRTIGSIHTLVNNAGICWYGQFKDMPSDRLQNMILLNCMAYAKLSRLFLPSMVEANEGGILNVSSVAAFQPVPTLGLYAATKAFTQSMTEAIRNELPKDSKVTVSTLNPPFTKTHLVQDAGVPDDFLATKISFMNVEDVTRKGHKAFRKGKIRYIPGLHNSLFYLGMVKYLPYSIISNIVWLLTRRLSDLKKLFK